MEGIEMLNDVASPRSKKKKARSGGSVSSRKSSKSLKSTKSSKSKRKLKELKAAKKGTSTLKESIAMNKDSSSRSLKIEDNVSLISDDSVGSFSQDDTTSLRSSSSRKSTKSTSSRKSLSASKRSSSHRRSRRNGAAERCSSMGNVKRGSGRSRSSRSPKRSNSMSAMSSKKESKRSEKSKRRGSMGTHSSKKKAARRAKERRASNESYLSTDDGESLDQPNPPAVAKIDEDNQHTTDVDGTKIKKSDSKKARHNSANTESSSTSGGAIPAQVTVGEGADGVSSAPPKRPSVGSLDDEILPMDEVDMVRYMEERSKKLDPKDANLALTVDADHRVDLQAEVAELLAGVAGPEFVEDVCITINGEKRETVKVNSLQFYMTRYAELTHDLVDVV